MPELLAPARRAAAVLGALTLCTALAACGGPPAEEPTRDEVTYLTSFSTFGRDAYAYVAEEKGFFAEAGFDVDIQPGTGTVDVLKLVAGKRADFGIGDFSTTAVTIANEGLPVVAVGAIHQKSLAALATLEGSGIEKPADLAGRTVADQPGSTNQVIFPVYAQQAGIDPSSVQFIPSAPPSLPQLLASGRVDAIGQFVVARGLLEAAAPGRKALFLPYGDLLPDLYGNALVTSSDLAEQNPELVTRFRGALLRGLQYSIEHPEETGKILAERQPTQDAAVAAGEVEAMAGYVTGDAGVALGSLDSERVTKVISILTGAGAIAPGLTPDDVVEFGLATGA